jgi:hypothetical protein
MSECEAEPAVASVALAVELRAASEPAWVPAPPRRRLGQVLPVAVRSDVELCGELRRVQAVESMLAAYKTELVLALAAQRPAAEDPAAGAPGAAATWGPGQVRLPEVSEFSPTSSARCCAAPGPRPPTWPRPPTFCSPG